MEPIGGYTKGGAYRGGGGRVIFHPFAVLQCVVRGGEVYILGCCIEQEAYLQGKEELWPDFLYP